MKLRGPGARHVWQVSERMAGVRYSVAGSVPAQLAT